MRLGKVFMASAVLDLAATAVPATAHEEDYSYRRYRDRYYVDPHVQDHRKHWQFHRRLNREHDRAHQEGFYSREEHRAYHRDRRFSHRDFHDDHPGTWHDHDRRY